MGFSYNNQVGSETRIENSGALNRISVVIKSLQSH